MLTDEDNPENTSANPSAGPKGLTASRARLNEIHELHEELAKQSEEIRKVETRTNLQTSEQLYEQTMQSSDEVSLSNSAQEATVTTATVEKVEKQGQEQAGEEQEQEQEQERQQQEEDDVTNPSAVALPVVQTLRSQLEKTPEPNSNSVEIQESTQTQGNENAQASSTTQDNANPVAPDTVENTAAVMGEHQGEEELVEEDKEDEEKLLENKVAAPISPEPPENTTQNNATSATTPASTTITEQDKQEAKPSTVAFSDSGNSKIANAKPTDIDYFGRIESIYGKGNVDRDKSSYTIKGKGITYDFSVGNGSVTVPANLTEEDCEKILKTAEALGKKVDLANTSNKLTEEQSKAFINAAKNFGLEGSLVKPTETPQQVAAERQAQIDKSKKIASAGPSSPPPTANPSATTPGPQGSAAAPAPTATPSPGFSHSSSS